MITTEKLGGQYVSVQEKKQYLVIFDHLYSDEYQKRRIGYALCIPKYHQFSIKLRLVIKQIWKTEIAKEDMDEEFIKLCNRVFT